MQKRTIISLALLLILVIALTAAGPPSGNASRIVVWRPRKGMERDFEEGYKRHLDWHRKNADPWSWYGWTVISGEHYGDFVDGTFFHAWTDFDSPVSPSADSADNAVNVFPYGDVQSVVSYELIPSLSDSPASTLGAPLVTFCYLRVRLGAEADFESRVKGSLGNFTAANGGDSPKWAFFRPVNGSSEYLLVVSAQKQSELPLQAQFVGEVTRAVNAPKEKTDPLKAVRTETLRYRADLSFTH